MSAAMRKTLFESAGAFLPAPRDVLVALAILPVLLACLDAHGGTPGGGGNVTVGSIQYNDPDEGFVTIDEDDTLYVMKGTTVRFKAIPSPPEAGWPEGKPAWEWSSGATGTVDEEDEAYAEVTFSETGNQTVKAKCGNTKTVHVTVYELTGYHEPQVWFDYRATVTYGVAEKANLSWTVSPNGITAAEMGGLQWSIEDGDGYLDEAAKGNTGQGVFTADWTNCNVGLRLVVLSGPSKGKYCDMGFTVTQPTDFVFAQHGTGIWHRKWHASCGFRADTYLRPKDVSFAGIEFGEEEVQSVRAGWFLQKYPDPAGCVHQANGGATVGDEDAATGCLVSPPDNIWSGPNDPPPDHAEGTFRWPIRQRWRIGAGGWTLMRAANQDATINAAGTVTIQKDDLPTPPASKALTEDDSDW